MGHRGQCHRDRLLLMPEHGSQSSPPVTSGIPDAACVASSHHGQPLGPARWRHSSGDEATLNKQAPCGGGGVWLSLSRERPTSATGDEECAILRNTGGAASLPSACRAA